MKLDTSPVLWTAAGRARQEEKVKRLRAHHLELLRLAGEQFTGGVIQVSQECFGDYGAELEERRQAKKDLDEAEGFLNRIQVIYPPRQTATVQVGHEVRIRYLDDCVRKKRGEEESFILGGINECDDDEIIRTFSCNSPLGRAIVRKEVGDEVFVRTPRGDEYWIEIVSIKVSKYALAVQKA